MPTILGTIVWWLGGEILTQTTLREGENHHNAETRAREHFAILNPGERCPISFANHKFYPLGK